MKLFKGIRNRFLAVAVFVFTAQDIHAQVLTESWRDYDSRRYVGGTEILYKSAPGSNNGVFSLALINEDIVVLEHSNTLSAMDTIWFASNGIGLDKGFDMVRSNTNLIYVSGYVYVPGQNNDVFVACFDDYGNILWEKTWNNSANRNDEINRMAMLPGGNIALAGRTEVSSGRYLPMLQIWSPAGALLAVQQYTSNMQTGSYDDQFTDIGILPDSSIVTCGFTTDSVQGKNGLLCNYNPSGTTLNWTSVYNSVQANNDRFNKLGVDNNSIYTGGECRNGTRSIVRRYDNLGTLQWSIDTIASAKSVVDIDFDSGGNAYFGMSTGNLSVYKYSPSGTSLWYYSYVPQYYGVDLVSDIYVDPSDNIYVCGRVTTAPSFIQQGLVKVNAAGQYLWYRERIGSDPGFPINGHSGIMPLNGNILATGYQYDVPGDHNGSLVLYDANGTIIDSAIVADSTNRGIPAGIEKDVSGNIYALFTTIVNGMDVIGVHKRNQSGGSLWQSFYADSSILNIKDFTIDSSSNVYVTSIINRPSTGNDILLYKIDPAGNIIWTTIYNMPGYYQENPHSIITDAAGAVYISCDLDSGNTSITAVLKYSPTGNLLWKRSFTGSSLNINNQAGELILDETGNIYFTMSLWNAVSARDMCLARIDTTGNVYWKNCWTGIGGYNDAGVMVVKQTADQIVVGGSSAASGTGYNIKVCAFNSAGNVVWDITQATADPDETKGMVVLNSKVYVTGELGFLKPCVFALDTAGTILWNYAMMSNNNWQGIPAAITVNRNNGYIAMAGTFVSAYNIFTVVLDSTGIPVDTAFTGWVNSDAACDIMAHEGGFIVQADIGYHTLGSLPLSAVIKYCAGPTIQCSADTSVCPGDSIQLQATSGLSQYLWSPSGTLSNNAIYNPMAWPAVTTTYTVTALNSNGCSSYSKQKIEVRPVPQIGFAPASAISCAGDTIAATVLGVTYCTWTPNVSMLGGQAISNLLWPSNSQVYQVSGSDPWGCSAVDSFVVTSIPLPAVTISPLPDTICYSSTLTGLAGTPAGGSFSGAGVTGSLFNPVLAGLGSTNIYYQFTDTVTGCTATATEMVIVDTCSVQSVNEEYNGGWSIFPNPVSNLELKIKKNSLNKEVIEVRLFNSLGATVLTEFKGSEPGEIVYSIALPDLADGIYCMQINTKDKVCYHKLVIKKN